MGALGASPSSLSRLALRTRWRLLDLLAARGAAEAGPPVHLLGLVFPGPVGLAAGFDRHGRLFEGAAALGLGAVEAGTVFAGQRRRVPPPAAQPGGARRGISLGKPQAIPWPSAEHAFLQARREHGAGADTLCLNPGRDCPSAARFAGVVAAVAEAEAGGRPLLVKLGAHWPDPAEAAALWVAAGARGILVAAEGSADPPGVLLALRRRLGAGIALVSVGGIASAREALARRAAGADLVQIHRGLVQRGPALIGEINRAWRGGAILPAPSASALHRAQSSWIKSSSSTAASPAP